MSDGQLRHVTSVSSPGQELLAAVTDAPAELAPAPGRLTPQRLLKLEWEEAVKMSWLQQELQQGGRVGEAGAEAGLVARGQADLLHTLAAVMREAPLYVKALLCRHICAVLKVIVHRAGHKSELELMDAAAIPENLAISEPLLQRAVTLLEIAADSRCLVMLLKFLLDRAPMERHPGYAFIAVTLMTHLRTVRALELTSGLWRIALGALVKAEAAQKSFIVRKIEDLLMAMVRESPHNIRHFQSYLATFKEGSRSAAVKGIEQMMREQMSAEEAPADPGAEDIAALEQPQRPELAQAIEAMLAGAATCEATAELLLKRLADIGGNDAALVSCVVRAAVTATVKEGRGGARPAGAAGVAMSQCVALMAALEARRNSREDLAKLALHFVIRSILEPESAAAARMSDGATPNSTVDTPQPQTPFSPATPDSLPVAKKSSAADDDAAMVAQVCCGPRSVLVACL